VPANQAYSSRVPEGAETALYIEDWSTRSANASLKQLGHLIDGAAYLPDRRPPRTAMSANDSAAPEGEHLTAAGADHDAPYALRVTHFHGAQA
jgi:hypothetical protein